MTPLGGSKRVIRKSASGHCWMAWSPDGKLLAYSDEEDGNNGIFLMSSTGSDSQRLTTAPQKTSEKYPAFSPDSQQIAFVRESTVYGADIYAVPVSRGESIFFFQAEDGIRDLTVTGVQTCALPI